MFGKWLMQHIDEPAGVDPIFLDDFATSCYCALMQSGELLIGAADMSVIEGGVDWPRLRPRLPDLGAGDFLILEANLSPQLVRRLIRHAGSRTRIVFESVSVAKLLRHAEVLRNLYLLSGNEAELRALGEWFRSAGDRAEPVGRSAASSSDAWIDRFMRQRKIERMLMTRAGRGVRLYRRDSPLPGAGVNRLSLRPQRLLPSADTTGAGDRLLSAYLEALRPGAAEEPALRQALTVVESSIEEGSL